MISIFDIGAVVAYARSTVPAMVSLISPTGIPLSPPAGFAAFNMEITRSAGVSFSHTAGPSVFASIFNERLGQLEIQGLTYTQRCVPPYGPFAMSWLNTLYAQHGLSQLAAPLYIWTSGGSVCGYLVGCGASINSKLPGIVSFGMVLKIL